MKSRIMKRILCFSLITMMVCTVMPVPPLIADAATNTEILESQLDMPIVCINSTSSITSKETYVDATASVYDEKGELNVDTSNISIRLRGNSTMNSPKKSYRMKFETKQNLLDIGDGAGKPWNLVSCCYDTSLLRNLTAYEMGDMLDGMPYTPNSRCVEVYLNGNYQGVYMLCEAVNINKNRVNIAENTEAVEDNGYLIEMSRYAEENYFEVGLQRYEIKNDLSLDNTIAQQQKDYINSYITECYEAIQHGDRTLVESLIDMDSFVDIYIASEVVKNVDAGWDSFYMYKDSGGKLTFGPMWDFDLALGNFIDVKGFNSWKGLNIYDVANISSNSNPWFCYIVKQDWFRDLVAERWNEKIEELQTLDEFVTDEAAANKDSYARNFTQWNVLGKKVFSEPDEIAELSTHTAHAEYLSDWIENRVNWLDEYFNSDGFAEGVLIDEEGKEISEDVNIAEYSTKFMMFASDYTIDDTPSCTVNFASDSWRNQFQMCMSGVMMEEGVEYLVSFDCTATKNMDVKWKVQQNYGSYRAYNSGSIGATSEVQHYETTFTADKNDFNCAFIIESAGSSGSSITVSNIVLRKISKDTIKGDANADGNFNVADVIMLQKWLLCGADITDMDAGDVYEDNRIDVLDLCIMKEMLIS